MALSEIFGQRVVATPNGLKTYDYPYRKFLVSQQFLTRFYNPLVDYREHRYFEY